MKFSKWLRAQMIIAKVARLYEKTPAEVRRDMQEAIDAAWEAESQSAQEAQLRRFPTGKPSVEDLMWQLGKEIVR